MKLSNVLPNQKACLNELKWKWTEKLFLVQFLVQLKMFVKFINCLDTQRILKLTTFNKYIN